MADEKYPLGKLLWLATCDTRKMSQDRAELEWRDWEEGDGYFMTKGEWQQAAEKFANAAGVPVVHDCPTCAHRDSPGAKGPCKSCSVLWKPENGGCEDNWTPIPAGVIVVDEPSSKGGA